MPETAELRLMATVKAYPTPSTKYEETVCCAGVTEDHRWVRLYPVPYRDLPGQGRFRKYDILEVVAERREPHKDNRPESWRPHLDTLRIVDRVPVGNNWSARMEWIRPTILDGYDHLLRLQESENRSMGAFRPARILGLTVEPNANRWSSAQLATINQGDLFSDKEPLEEVPYRFKIGFEDEVGKPHWLSVIDWEFFELWRKERTHHGSEENACEQVRRKLEQVTSEERDLVLFAGNQANPQRRRTFQILGCCWPKSDPQGQLF